MGSLPGREQFRKTRKPFTPARARMRFSVLCLVMVGCLVQGGLGVVENTEQEILMNKYSEARKAFTGEDLDLAIMLLEDVPFSLLLNCSFSSLLSYFLSFLSSLCPSWERRPPVFMLTWLLRT